mmetsp:Transcript_27029/g.37727  ORF Transcript_27029/g.37727 Transcript_27029/m.37727 type:complete len:361 (+) Transcript_27029:63-1145(+)
MSSSSDEDGPARRRMDSDDEDGNDSQGRGRLDSSDEEDNVAPLKNGGGGEENSEEKDGEGSRKKKKKKRKKRDKKEKKKKKKKKKKKSKSSRRDSSDEDEEERATKKRRREKDGGGGGEGEDSDQDGGSALDAKSVARIEKILSEIEQNPDPEFIAEKLGSDLQFASYVANNEAIAAAIADKSNAYTERMEAAEKAAQTAEKEDEEDTVGGGEKKAIDMGKIAMDGCLSHPDEVVRVKSFQPLADGSQAKKLHAAAMSLEQWQAKKAELAEAEKKRFLAAGNVMGKVRCRHCKGPHWSAGCPKLQKKIKKEDAIGGGGGYKKPFWNCLKCGAENSNKRKQDCYKCGALWRSGWAKSGQAW